MNKESVRCEVQDRIAVVTIDRPPANALGIETYREIGKTFIELSNRDDVQVAILTGAGERFFCAGGDVKEIAARTPESARERLSVCNACFSDIYGCSVPVIGAINGIVTGGGLGLAANCDFRIASEKAVFLMTEIDVGVFGGARFISHMFSTSVARMMMYTAQRMSAEEAYRLGAVVKVVPPEKLITESKRMAEIIASKSPAAIRLTKRGLNAIEPLNWRDAEDIELEYYVGLVSQAAAKEATTSFLEKRAPRYREK
jgi:enoyl-CoA hydratase